MPAGWTVYDVDGLGTGEPAAVAGLVPDSAADVSIVVNGIKQEATVQNNGFFYQLGNNTQSPEAVIVSYEDGRASTIRIDDALVTPGE